MGIVLSSLGHLIPLSGKTIMNKWLETGIVHSVLSKEGGGQQGLDFIFAIGDVVNIRV